MRISIVIANKARIKGALQHYFLLKPRVWHVPSQSNALLIRHNMLSNGLRAKIRPQVRGRDSFYFVFFNQEQNKRGR